MPLASLLMKWRGFGLWKKQGIIMPLYNGLDCQYDEHTI